MSVPSSIYVSIKLPGPPLFAANDTKTVPLMSRIPNTESPAGDRVIGLKRAYQGKGSVINIDCVIGVVHRKQGVSRRVIGNGESCVGGFVRRISFTS
jgi:hypothetical protein